MFLDALAYSKVSETAISGGQLVAYSLMHILVVKLTAARSEVLDGNMGRCCFRELANVLEKWRRASDNQAQASGSQTREAVYLQQGSNQPTVQQDRK